MCVLFFIFILSCLLRFRLYLFVNTVIQYIVISPIDYHQICWQKPNNANVSNRWLYKRGKKRYQFHANRSYNVFWFTLHHRCLLIGCTQYKIKNNHRFIDFFAIYHFVNLFKFFGIYIFCKIHKWSWISFWLNSMDEFSSKTFQRPAPKLELSNQKSWNSSSFNN